MSRRQRIAFLGLAVVAIVVVAIVVGTSGGSNDQPTTGPVAIRVKDEKPVGGVKPITVKQGGTVRFSVSSDSAQEIHVHGYNVHKDVAAGGRVAFSFPAKIDGIFVVELEQPGVQIASLKVTP
jgi:hypothetical protein